MVIVIIVLEVLMCGVATTLLTAMDDTRIKRKPSTGQKMLDNFSKHSKEGYKGPIHNVRFEEKILAWDDEKGSYVLVDKK